MSAGDKQEPFDAVVIGTGFAGAVTACRLVEAGFKICVLERGRRYEPQDFPQYPADELFTSGDEGTADTFAPLPDFSRFLWRQDHGIYDVRHLDDVVSVSAAGYGGGSLIYANVHLRPPRDVFADGWPREYNEDVDGVWRLKPYFDLAAYMLRVSPIPVQLAKTLQLKRAAEALRGGGSDHWFRVPLAVNFTGQNDFGREQHQCDMRGRCWLGCDNRSKNTLDLNYLARAEDGDVQPDIRTLAEATKIERHDGLFKITYNDLIFRAAGTEGGGRRDSIFAKYVFLCAGALNTTELLLDNRPHLDERHPEIGAPSPLGSRYFPNSDTFSAVFDCDQPHEADYGPTITAAILYQADAKDDRCQSIDFAAGPSQSVEPGEGTTVWRESGATAVLAAAPLFDWGTWKDGGVGTFVLAQSEEGFQPQAGETLVIDNQVKVRARSRVIRHRHWFLVEDGGYPPDLEALIGVFRSPLWLRRNRYLETRVRRADRSDTRRPLTEHLRLHSITDSLSGMTRGAGSRAGFLNRALDPSQFRATDLLAGEASWLFPDWFVKALMADRDQLLEGAAAMALPLLGRFLDELSRTAAKQVDSRTLQDFLGVPVDDEKKEVLVRGMLRQALQIVAGSEAAAAGKIATLLFEPLPAAPGKIVNLLGDALLWAIGYGLNKGNTALLLTMGRDRYRGRLQLVHDATGRTRLSASMPKSMVDPTTGVHERVLRKIVVSQAWNGELRTSPMWTALGTRVSVHNQGGCPMGDERDFSVTDRYGEVHWCPGLYVMDAAAFPTSVGVNPSATIAAVAEFKIERFIRQHGRGDLWRAKNHADVPAWLDELKRNWIDIDPFNGDHLGDDQEDQLPHRLGLESNETMQGFFAAADRLLNFTDLRRFPRQVREFTKAEDKGIARGESINTTLTLTSDDLSRLIARDSKAAPPRVAVSGEVEYRGEVHAIEAGSFMQLFVRPLEELDPPMRFFRYILKFEHAERRYELEGLKILRDAPGFDLWADTSTLYCELRRMLPDGPQAEARGVMRISITGFEEQLRSMDVTGTSDPARRSWALAAFYRYFASELETVYVSRPDLIKSFLARVLTGINV